MDLLYYLQNIRLVCPDWFISVIVILSESTLILATIVPCCIYLSLSKKKGTYMVCALVTALLFNELIKVTCCIYRPWILDSRLTPVAQVVGTATNYSFPSSHSCAIAAVCTALVLAFPGKRNRTAVAVLFVLLVMFSRMFLGCHTLKDVCVGAAVGTCVAFLFSPMLSDTFDEEGFTRLILPAALILAAAGIIYVILKPYPLDYNADGSLIVDPVKMRTDTIGSCGMVAGTGIGLFLERKFVGFPMPTCRKQAVIRAAAGTVIFALFYIVIIKKLIGWINPSVYKFIRYSVCIVIVAAAYPAVIKFIHGRYQ